MIKSLDLKRGDKVYYFQREDPSCWSTSERHRRVIEYTVNSWSENFDPVFGRCYGVIESGKSEPVFIHDRFFENYCCGTPSCFLSREAAVQAVLEAGYEIDE